MRHRVKDKKFNRDSNHRKALLRNLVRALVERGSITTTVPKAKETKRQVDRLFAKARVDSVLNRRLLHTFFGKRDVVNTIFDKIMPVMGKRTSGFTRITQAGIRRGDNTQMVTLSLVEIPQNIGSLKRPVDAKNSKDVVSSVSTKKTSSKVSQKKTVAAKKTTAKKTEKKVSKKVEKKS